VTDVRLPRHRVRSRRAPPQECARPTASRHAARAVPGYEARALAGRSNIGRCLWRTSVAHWLAADFGTILT